MLLELSFDGTAYHGWQVQPNGITVQETLQNALEKLLGKRPGVTGCSRTDAGVHARQFCCHFDTEKNLPLDAYLRGLNSLLPSDIAVTGCRVVKNDFHARYDAKGKTYIYRILNSKSRDPFRSRYMWQIERELNEERMNDFCAGLVGRHNFAAFSSSGRTVEDTVRTIKECTAEKKGDVIELSVTADGFLYNMVRIIVGTAVMASDGKIEAADLNEIFRSGDRSLTGITAPANGLFLEKVIY